MQSSIPLGLTLLTYGSILLTGLVVLVIMRERSRLIYKKNEQEAALLAERNKSIEALNRNNMDIAHRQGLHTVGTLTSGIAHEVNNLLTPIMGYSMLALENVSQDDEELYDNILEIYETARRAKEIVSRLSDLTRKKSTLLLKFVELDSVIGRAVDVITPIKGLNITFEIDLQCKNVYVFADETRLHQMIINLCVNSMQAMEDCDRGALELRTYEKDNRAHILVRDTGCGIAQDDLHTIFEPFFTTKDAGKGTGLGLAIVSQIVNEMDGDIEVKSKVGEGTSMLISLPLPKDNT